MSCTDMVTVGRQRKELLALTTGWQVSYIPKGLDHTLMHTHTQATAILHWPA